jgi:uncharacterized protein YegJ (DUF2314 family)
MNFLRKLFGSKRENRVSCAEENPDGYHVPNRTAAMNWAIEKAGLTFRYFKESLISPQPGQTYFSLKAKIVDGSKSEHLWLRDVSCDDTDIFYGTVADVPATIHNLSRGTRVGVERTSARDWMIIENGRLIGGYTIRCIRDAMREKEQRKFDSTIDFLIDEGVDHFEHDLSTPEGAILSIEDAYAEQDLERVISCKNFEMEATFMLAKNKALDRLANDRMIIAETAKAFKLNFIKFIDENGFPNFNNVQRAFSKREFVNPDLCIVTEVCRYADQTKSIERIYCGRGDNQWYVMNPAD